jgi:hypothetical protein
MTDKRIRHCPFIIDNVTKKDLKKLRHEVEQIKQGDSKFKFLIFVKNGTKVYGYSISNQQYFKTLRNMLSAKTTEAEMGDFQHNTSGAAYEQAYYDERGNAEMAGQYSSQGSRSNVSGRCNELEEGLEEADNGEGFDGIVAKRPRLSVGQQKQIRMRVNKVREDQESERVALESSQRVLEPWEKDIIEKLPVSLSLVGVILSGPPPPTHTHTCCHSP